LSETPTAPRLGLATKVSYGLGSVAQATAGVAISQSLITFFLVRVVGMRPGVVGLLILISLAIDAVFDPLIGRLSDTLRSPWGRRHPFMYASALPIALAIAFFWHTPHGLPPAALAAYSLALLVIVRLSVSLYQIPSDALTPELAPDYHERTGLLSYRYFFSYTGGTALSVILGVVYLRKDASHPLGQYDRAAYANFGLLAAGVTFAAILLSSAVTHRYIRTLWRAPVRQQSLPAALREMAATLGNPSLVVVIGAGLLSGISTGISSTLGLFMSYYFWDLTPQVSSWINAASVPSFFTGVFLAPILSRRYGKKRTTIVLFALAILSGVVPPVLRLLGLLPPNGSLWIPVILAVDGLFSTTLALAGFIIIGSMIADVTEDNAVKTGMRSEGLLFAASNLLPKFAPGIGGLIGALILELVRFPVGAQTTPLDHVDPTIMRNMVLLWLPATMGLNLLAVALICFYRLDRSSHEANIEALGRAAVVMQPLTTTPIGEPPIPGATG
jgi:Na+/melibiose symporter-like transporter